jgi:protein O-mannosyl-transferase
MRNVSPKTWHRVRASLAIVAIGILSYANTFSVPFLLDDSARIVDNPKIRSLIPTAGSLETNRPVVDYTFAINYAIHGLQLWGYHAVNLGIHLAAALCLYGIVRRSLLRTNGQFAKHAELLGLIVALIWVAHPLQTQAVTYINQRYESLMGLAYLATLYTLIRSFDSHRATLWLIASVVICALGMGCKEAMVSAPLVMLWYDRAFVAKSWGELLGHRRVYYLALAGTWGVLAWVMLHFTGEYTAGGMLSVPGLTPWTYLLSQSEVITHYLSLAIWPQGQCFWAKWPVAQGIADVWPCGLLIVGLLSATVLAIFRSPKISFLGGWFFLILAPTSSFAPIRDLIFEHRMYLPLAAVCCAFVLGMSAALLKFVRSQHSPILGLALICGFLVAALSIATYQRNEVYRSEVAIWQDTVAKSPHHAAAWHNLAMAHIQSGQSTESLNSLRQAYRLEPDNPRINSSLGAALLQAGDGEEAKSYLAFAIDHSPQDSLALRNMGNAMLDTANFDTAIDFLSRSQQLTPHDKEAQLSLAAAFGMAGRFDESIQQSHQTLKEYPGNAQAHFNLMSVFTQLGRFPEAIEQGQLSITSEPQDAMTHGRLGMLLASTQPEKSIEHLELACQLDPNIPEFVFILGVLLTQDHPAKAITHFEALVAMEPKNIEARKELAQAYARTGQEAKAAEQRQAILNGVD